MRSRLSAATFRSTILHRRDAAAASPPSYVLLDPQAYLADRSNATTATALTSTGHTVEVSFWLADPPAVSHFCVHCPGLKGEDFAEEALIVGADGAFVLLGVSFTCEYLVYRSRPGEPSLELLPSPHPRVFGAQEVGLLCCADDGSGEHFVVAVLEEQLAAGVSQCDLHVFSSKTTEWSTKVAMLDSEPSCDRDKILFHYADKVIAVGGGTLGWVDLWRGMLVCNLLDEMPVVRFIPVPEPMAGNKGVCPDGCPQPVRDVTCSNGFIKLVEIDLLDDDGGSCLDAELLDSWTATTWQRMTCWEDWQECRTVDVADISVEDPSHSDMLPELWDDKAEKPTLRKLRTAAPTLSVHDDSDDIVYLMSKVNDEDPEAWVAAVDMRKKTLEALAPFSAERISYCAANYRPCLFVNYQMAWCWLVCLLARWIFEKYLMVCA